MRTGSLGRALGRGVSSRLPFPLLRRRALVERLENLLIFFRDGSCDKETFSELSFLLSSFLLGSDPW